MVFFANGNNKTHLYFSKHDGRGGFWKHCLVSVTDCVELQWLGERFSGSHTRCFLVHSLHNLRACTGIAPLCKAHFSSCSALLFCTSLAWNNFNFFWSGKFLEIRAVVLWAADLIWAFLLPTGKSLFPCLSLQFLHPHPSPLLTPGIILFCMRELPCLRGKQNLMLLFKSLETVTPILLCPSQFYTWPLYSYSNHHIIVGRPYKVTCLVSISELERMG